MKQILLAMVLILGLTATAQERTMKVYKNGEVTHSILISDIDSVKIETTEVPTTGIINGHEYVDLGLPSGLKWATCNVGAFIPEEYGAYFAWGETGTKSDYTEHNSITYGKTMSDISGNAKYDVATANWGGTWRMPTSTEIDELINNCIWAWTHLNGVNGYKVIGKTGNYIFLPAAGHRDWSSLDSVGSGGWYWSSEPDESYPLSNAHYLGFYSAGYFSSIIYRYRGNSVRPVTE